MHNESTETYEDYILENGLDQNDHYNMLGNGSDANDHDQIQDMSHFLDIQVEEGEENSTELDPLDPQDIEDGLFEQNYEENASENGDIPSDLDDRHYLDGEVTNEDYQPWSSGLVCKQGNFWCHCFLTACIDSFYKVYKLAKLNPFLRTTFPFSL